MSFSSTDMHWRYQNLRHLDPCIGLNLGILRFFPVIKIIVVHQVRVFTCMYCGMRVKTKKRKMLRGALRSWAQQKSEGPQIEPHGWRRHYTGRYRLYSINWTYLHSWWILQRVSTLTFMITLSLQIILYWITKTIKYYFKITMQG